MFDPLGYVAALPPDCVVCCATRREADEYEAEFARQSRHDLSVEVANKDTISGLQEYIKDVITRQTATEAARTMDAIVSLVQELTGKPTRI